MQRTPLNFQAHLFLRKLCLKMLMGNHKDNYEIMIVKQDVGKVAKLQIYPGRLRNKTQQLIEKVVWLKAVSL